MHTIKAVFWEDFVLETNFGECFLCLDGKDSVLHMML